MTGHLMIPEILVFSKKAWDGAVEGRPGADREGRQGGAAGARGLWYEMEKKSIAQMKEAGAVINEVADRKPFQAAVKPVWDKYGAQHTALIQRIQDVK